MFELVPSIFRRFINGILNLGLQRKVVLFISLGTILPFIVMMFFLLYSLSNTAVNVEKKTLEETTVLVKQSLLDSVSTKAQIYDLTFKGMAVDLESLKEQILGTTAIEKLLTDYYYRHQAISAVYFIDASRSIFISPASAKFNQRDKIDLSGIKEFDFLSSETENKYIGRWVGPYQDFKSETKIISYILPVWQGNEYRGIVAFDLSISSLFNEIVRVDPSQSSYFFLTKRDGELISSSEKIYDEFGIDKTNASPNIFDSQLIKDLGISKSFTLEGPNEGTFTIAGEKEGNEKIAAFSIIPSFGGKLVVVSPLTEIIQVQKEKAKEIQQTVTRLGTVGLVAMILLSVFIIIISFFLAGQITGPIITLRNASREISKGNFQTKIEIKTGDEIGELATDFNTMAIRLLASRRELEKYARELENRVKERTKELKSERDRVNAIITSIGEGLVVVDQENKIILTNPVAEKSLGISLDKVRGQDITEVIPLYRGDLLVEPEERPIVRAVILGKTQVYSLEDNFYFKSTDGRKFPVIIVTAPLFGEAEEEIAGVVMMFRDVTEEKQLDEAKTSFISVSSHQLRTPLTSMRWFAEMLMAGDAGKITSEQRHFVERIYQGTDRMIALVNLLLQIARVEAGRVMIEPTPVDLKNLTRGVLVALKANLDEKSQKVIIKSEPEDFPSILMDQEIIWQVVQNLISNANRYAPVKGTIYVSIIKKDNMAEYSVKDEGIGIPEEQKNRIFEKFYRAENAVRSVPTGSGLGLSLVKLLVEGWGGKVWFESKEGKGTTFYFTVPLAGVKAKKGEVKISV